MTKKLKATLAMFLCAVMVLCSVAVGGMVASAETVSGYCGDDSDNKNLTWTFDTATGELIISGTSGMKYYDGASNYPWHSYRSNITKLTIGDNVTSICNAAFSGCENLKKVTIGSGLTNIGVSPFLGCIALEEITVDTNNTSFSSEDGVLFNLDKIYSLKTELIKYPAAKSDKSFTIPQTVTKIQEYAFENCKSLEEIVIPDKVETMGSYAFYGCENLKKVTIGSGVTSIGSYVFEDNNVLEEITVEANNTNFSSEDGVLFNKDKTRLIKYPQAKADKLYSIPQTVTEIQVYAFHECKSLEEIVISNKVETIGTGAFYGCENLKYVFYAGSQEDWSSIDAWRNNEKLNDAVIHYNATGHTLAEGKCTVTGCDYACDHTGNKNKATCTEPCLCSICTKELSPATGHTFGEWKVTKSATFFKDGVETRTCVNEGCTETETRVVLSKFSEFKSGLFGVDFLKAILTVFADLLTSVC